MRHVYGCDRADKKGKVRYVIITLVAWKSRNAFYDAARSGISNPTSHSGLGSGTNAGEARGCQYAGERRYGTLYPGGCTAVNQH